MPPGLTVDTYGDYGFVAIAMVQTTRLRPAFLSSARGVDLFLTGYRVFTRFATKPSLRGLRILRSDTDRLLTAVGGNLWPLGRGHSISFPGMNGFGSPRLPDSN